MDQPILQLDSVRKQYGSVVALDDASVELDAGQVFGLLGPNGAGKSTLLDLVVGFRYPTDGSVRTCGLDPAVDPRTVRSKVGILPDATTVLPNWTGRRHLSFAMESAGVPGNPAGLAERVGISEAIDRPSGNYSKGMQRRLLLAMALVGEPELILLDEPGTGLDPQGMEYVREIVTQEREQGTTVVFSSHRLHNVESVADHVSILVDGHLRKPEPVSSLTSNTHSVLKVSVDPVPDSLDAIASMDGVEEAIHRNGSLEITCTGSAKKAVLDALERQGLTIQDVKTEGQSLVDYFLETVQ